MKNFILTSTFLTLSTASHAIVGGWFVDRYEDANFTVRVEPCAATVINEEWVLTAGHCVSEKDTRWMTGGSLSLDKLTERYYIKKVIKHPLYKKGVPAQDTVTVNDIALLQLDRKIDFSKSPLKPAKIADPDFVARGGELPGIMATVYGWGEVGENERGGTTHMHSVEVPIAAMEIANLPYVYNNFIRPTMLPAGYITGGKDACQGDSGGPLIVHEGNERVLVGIVSWSAGCARVNKFGIYTRVSAFYDWIQETMKANSN